MMINSRVEGGFCVVLVLSPQLPGWWEESLCMSRSLPFESLVPLEFKGLLPRQMKPILTWLGWQCEKCKHRCYECFINLGWVKITEGRAPRALCIIPCSDLGSPRKGLSQREIKSEGLLLLLSLLLLSLLFVLSTRSLLALLALCLVVSSVAFHLSSHHCLFICMYHSRNTLSFHFLQEKN